MPKDTTEEIPDGWALIKEEIGWEEIRKEWSDFTEIAEGWEIPEVVADWWLEKISSTILPEERAKIMKWADDRIGEYEIEARRNPQYNGYVGAMSDLKNFLPSLEANKQSHD